MTKKYRVRLLPSYQVTILGPNVDGPYRVGPIQYRLYYTKLNSWIFQLVSHRLYDNKAEARPYFNTGKDIQLFSRVFYTKFFLTGKYNNIILYIIIDLHKVRNSHGFKPLAYN